MAKALAKAKTQKPPAKASPEPVDPGFTRVAAAFEGDRQVTAGKMMASFGLKVNGKIFAMMVEGKFVAKLPKARVDELVASGAGSYFDPRKNGRLMKEWLVLAGKKPAWTELAREAHAYVKGTAR
jgi:TfoX/Sxy family transcriptional regulator of competence genes